MYIDQGMHDIDDGELPVSVIQSGDRVRASVRLIDSSNVRFLIESDEDADRVIRAMVDAKRKRAAVLSGRPHAFIATAKYGSSCDECGLGAKSPLHAEPVITDSERDCPELNPDGGWPCYNSGPHDEHRDSNGGKWRTDGGILLPAGCDPDGTEMTGLAVGRFAEAAQAQS